MIVPLVLAVSTLLHVCLLFRFPLAPDETYYWEWSRHLSWGYYDQGPMVAWWIRATCLVFGDTQLGVRAGIVAAALATQILLYLLARDLFGPRVGLVSLVLAAITPLALVGSFVATYDPLVAAFWAAAAYAAARAMLFGSRRAWIAVGVSLGLGFLSKHTMALFVPCLLVFAVGHRDHRQWLRRPEPVLALLLGAALSAPNLWWQSRHSWVTLEHLFVLAGKGADQSLVRRLGDYVGSQALLITPLLFVALVVALVWSWRRGRGGGDARIWFLFSMAAPILLLFGAATVKAKVQANWAACGWLTPPILYAAWLDHRRRSSPGETRPRRQPAAAGAVSTAGLYASAAAIVCALLSLALIWPEGRALVGLRVPARLDQMNKLYGGPELGAAADRAVAAMEREGARQVRLGAVTYDNASRLAFYAGGQPRTCCLFLGTRLNSYALWPDSRPAVGADVVIADDRAPDDPGLAPFGAVFDRVVPELDPVPVYRRPVYPGPVRRYYLYRCYGYRPNPAVETSRPG